MGPVELRADCARCFGLCCVAPGFSASADFAIDKPAGQPCVNLRADFACGIHDRLREKGFAGCTVYDCFGAGQRIAQETFGGRDWRRHPDLARPMFAAFGVMRDLHELLWYLTAALALDTGHEAELRAALDATDALTSDLSTVDVNVHRGQVNAILVRVSEAARGRGGANFRGADLIGRDLRTASLRAANLRGAALVGADLRGVDLERADVTGADLRGADLRGADLTRTLFLTQSQLDAARGDAGTRLPPGLKRPAHWGATP